jgi:hypothetical protein
MKAGLLSLLNLAFFGFGFWFFNVPKIKNAGATFIAIGALLIPFTGLSWHNFVLEPQGYPIGNTWLATSLVAIVTYAGLAYYVRHPFYTYIAGFGGLSTILSIVNVTELNREFYILGGVFSSFILMLSTRVFSNPDEEIKKTFVQPLSISAHVIMPLSLAWGIVLATAADRLFTIEVVLAGILASLYYLLAYTFQRTVSYLFVAQFVFAFTVFVIGGYLDLETQTTFILVQGLALVYLGVNYLAKDKFKSEAETFFEGSQLLLPIATLLVVVNNTTLPYFNAHLTLAGLLATAFYALTYFSTRQVAFFAVTAALLPVTIFVAASWQDVRLLTVFYILECLSLLYLVGSYLLRKKFNDESQVLTIISLTASAILFVGSWGTNFSEFSITMFAAIPAVLGLIAFYAQKDERYLYYNIIFLAIATYLYFANLLDLEDRIHFVGLGYLFISLIFYGLAVYLRERAGVSQAFIFATLLNAAVGSILTVGEVKYFLVSNLLVAALLFDGSIRFKKYGLLYFSNLFLYLATWSALRTFEVRVALYPLYFGLVSAAIYGVSYALPKSIEGFYRLTGLVAMGSNSLLFGLMGQGTAQYSDYTYSSESVRSVVGLERNALISSYASFALYSLDAYLKRWGAMAYFASAVGMATYLWQMKYFNIDEILAYTLPLGVYFMALSYFQRRSGKESNSQALEYLGLFFLLIPPFFYSFGDNGALYALLLGFEGVVLLGIGITYKYRNFTYIGIASLVAAVLSQTYEFVSSLPRWIIVGAAGIVFLSVAIYLLLHRKEPEAK